jgi:hypothetical protein
MRAIGFEYDWWTTAAAKAQLRETISGHGLRCGSIESFVDLPSAMPCGWELMEFGACGGGNGCLGRKFGFYVACT